jgi:Domain of unknown function (DUF4281)
MSNQTLFGICNAAAAPGWIMLLAAPRWRWTQRIAMFTLPMLLAAVYVWVFIATFEGMHANFWSLGAAEYTFHTPGLVLLAWIHFLAFDLFVGAWMVRDARRLRILHLAVIPCLLLTFLFGPVGLLVYLLLRTSLRRGVEASQSAS